MAELVTNRPILITYKKDQMGNQRPPYYTTESNLKSQEQFFSNVIDEIYLVDNKGNIIKENKIEPKFVNNNITFLSDGIVFDGRTKLQKQFTSGEKTIEKEVSITDDLMYKELLKRGKSIEEINAILDIKTEEKPIAVKKPRKKTEKFQ